MMVGKQLIWRSGYMDENPSLRPSTHPSIISGWYQSYLCSGGQKRCP